MSTWIRAGLLAAAAVAVVGFSFSSNETYGQGKKAGKTTGIVQVNEGRDGKFRLVIRDNDDKYLVTSGAYPTKADALKGLESLKEAIENPKIVDTKSEKKGKGKEQ